MDVRKAAAITILCLGMITSSKQSFAGDWLSGTYLDPAQQRQDFFSHSFWNSIPEYRAVYNRPRYLSGYLAHKIEPSSQEAMAWKTNYCNGNYTTHAGPSVPHYYYPKPWESIRTAARPDFQAPQNK